MVDRVAPFPSPQDIQTIIPEPVNILTLHCKRDFAGVINGMVYEIGDYLGLFGWVQSNYIRQLFWLGQRDERKGEFEA